MFFGIKVLQLSALSFERYWSFLSAGGRQSTGRTSVLTQSRNWPSRVPWKRILGEKEWTGTVELRWKGNQNSECVEETCSTW